MATIGGETGYPKNWGAMRDTFAKMIEALTIEKILEVMIMKKTRFIALILVFAMLLPEVSAFAAGDGLTILLDGEALPDSGTAYVDENGRTMVPAAAFEGILEYSYMYSGGNMVGTILYESNMDRPGLYFYGDSNLVWYYHFHFGVDATDEPSSVTQTISYSLEGNFDMDTVAIVEDGEVYVPLRYALEYFGYTVEWDGDMQSVIITSPKSSFDFDLLAQMPRDKNYMISPVSLKLALAMAANGADGETKQEILDVLGISDLAQFNEEVRAFIERYNSNELVAFNIANSIWYNADYYQGKGLSLDGEAGSFSDEFARLIKTYYYGVAETITNDNGKETVNDWIAEQTNEKITDVVTDETVINSLALLVNAIYFKGDWQNPFKAESTRDAVFTDRNGAETTTAFMNDTGSYSYSETDSLQMLAKPYKDTSVRMYFILPKDDATLSQAMFDEALADMTSEWVHFSVPKFKTEYLHKNLKGILQGFGVKTAFSYPDADFWSMFDGIRPDMPIVIENIIQKTFIEVDEKGTEAAAVTVIDMAPTSAIKPDPVNFICDRPFTYIIRDDSTGTILFMGEYAFAE